MAKLYLALYDTIDHAQRAVDSLLSAGLYREDISLLTHDTSGDYQRYADSLDFSDARTARPDNDPVNPGEGAGFGAVVGTLVGLGVALLPGVGPIIALGPAAAALISGIGAAAGAGTGGIVGGLVNFGVPEDEAASYLEGVRRGGALVLVNTTDATEADVNTILRQHDPVDLETRSAEWRATEDAAPIISDSTGDAMVEQARQEAFTETSVTDERPDPAFTATTADPHDAPTRVPGASRVRTYSSSAFDSYEADYRADYDARYATTGDTFETYRPAYYYGYTLANTYPDQDWDAVYDQAYRRWEGRQPGTWDRFKEAVQEGWQRARRAAQ